MFTDQRWVVVILQCVLLELRVRLQSEEQMIAKLLEFRNIPCNRLGSRIGSDVREEEKKLKMCEGRLVKSLRNDSSLLKILKFSGKLEAYCCSRGLSNLVTCALKSKSQHYLNLSFYPSYNISKFCSSDALPSKSSKIITDSEIPLYLKEKR